MLVLLGIKSNKFKSISEFEQNSLIIIQRLD